MNKVIISGNLGADPRSFRFDNGNQKASFQLATDGAVMKNDKGEAKRDGNGYAVTRTDWVPVVMYGRNAEVAMKHLKKGRRVEIEGRLVSRSFDKNGQRRFVTEVVAQRMRFVPGGNGRKPAAGPNGHEEIDGDDAPF